MTYGPPQGGRSCFHPRFHPSAAPIYSHPPAATGSRPSFPDHRARTGNNVTYSAGSEAAATRLTSLLHRGTLGLSGSTSAFDNYFMDGFGLRTFGQQELVELGEFYRVNDATIETQRKTVATLDFGTGIATTRLCTRAKMIDMIFFVEGQRATQRRRTAGSGSAPTTQWPIDLPVI